MFYSAYTPARRLTRIAALSSVSTLALIASASLTSQAMAACTSPGTSIKLGSAATSPPASIAADCTGDHTNIGTISNPNGANGSLGIPLAEVYGVVLAADGTSLTNKGTISATITNASTVVSTTTVTIVGNATLANATKTTVVTAPNGAVISTTVTTPSTAENTAALAAVGHQTVTATNAVANTATVAGINTDIAGSYTVENIAGSISASTVGVGRVNGVSGGGNTQSLTVNNQATISASRPDASATFVKGAVTATSLTYNANSLGNSSLGVSAGIYAEEELESLTIDNSGTISATGVLSSGIYTRAGETEITNSGTITGAPMAIASVSDSGELRTLQVENSGTITGDIVAAGGSALRWWALSNGMGTSGATLDSRLNINSQFGQLDSTITNSGTITGNFYYGNGAHILTNEDGGTIVASGVGITVDQRAMTVTGRTCTLGTSNCFATGSAVGTVQQGILSAEAEAIAEQSSSELTAVSGTTATYTAHMWGSKDFTFENAGTMTGNITVATAPATTINGFDVPDSKVNLLPHIFGGGSLDKDDFEADAQAAINGALTVKDGIVNGNVSTGTSSLVRTTTITPVIDSLVKTGEWYTVATTLNDTKANAQALDVEGTALVSWTADKNISNALVIGSTVSDASAIDGLSGAGASTLNGLLGYDGSNEAVLALGGAVQNLKDEDDVRKAAEQLAPDTSFATQQAAFTLAALQGSAIDQRIGGSVASGGGSTSMGFAQPSGLGMGEGESQRMNLSASNEDERPSYGPSREGAWGQAFGAHLNDDGEASIGGYGADIWGFVAGYDNRLSPGFRVGGAFGYAQTTIDENGDRRGNRTDDESYSALAYASYKTSGWYMTGRTGFIWHTYDTVRKLTVPVTDEATGTHDGRQYNASAEIGAPMHFAGAAFTPLASLTYNNLDQDSYTEKSSAGMAFNIGSQETDSLVSGLGLRALVPIAAGTVLEGRAIWLHEFSDTNQIVTASFIGSDTSFTAAGADIGRDTANLGAGMTFDSGTGYSFQLNYDAFVRDDFVAQAGSGRVRVQF